jgi:peptidoglycan/LPS O-acetylase OafA/YrhL
MPAHKHKTELGSAAPVNPKHRHPFIQGLRAVAVVVVVAYHAGLPIPGGFVGVDVFFVISGFLISLILIADLQNNKFIYGTHY